MLLLHTQHIMLWRHLELLAELLLAICESTNKRPHAGVTLPPKCHHVVRCRLSYNGQWPTCKLPSALCTVSFCNPAMLACVHGLCIMQHILRQG